MILLISSLGGRWGRFRDLLAAQMPVVTFEPAWTSASTREMARAAAQMLDDRAHVLGESLGGMIATWLAVDAPALVDRLVLCSTLPRATMSAGRVLRAVPLLRRAHKLSPFHLVAAARHDAAGHLAQVRAPTLVLCGGRDRLLTVDSQRALLGAVPDATFEVVARAGHAITDDAPDDAAARVLEFLSSR